jgi:ASCH domain
MRCLSVQQPWAYAIVHADKRIENRTWGTPYRGHLLIHAGKSKERREEFDVSPVRFDDLDFGCIVGVCTLTNCVPAAQVRGEPFAEGPWCWLLDDVQALKPAPCKGQLGIFAAPDNMILCPKCAATLNSLGPSGGLVCDYCGWYWRRRQSNNHVTPLHGVQGGPMGAC